MSKIIRIGTRDSALALWQAKTVQSQLQHLGHETVLVPVKSTGDLVLNKPIYEKTAAYGHFGRNPEANGSFSWEKTDKTEVFSK